MSPCVEHVGVLADRDRLARGLLGVGVLRRASTFALTCRQSICIIASVARASCAARTAQLLVAVVQFVERLREPRGRRRTGAPLPSSSYSRIASKPESAAAAGSPAKSANSLSSPASAFADASGCPVRGLRFRVRHNRPRLVETSQSIASASDRPLSSCRAAACLLLVSHAEQLRDGRRMPVEHDARQWRNSYVPPVSRGLRRAHRRPATSPSSRACSPPGPDRCTRRFERRRRRRLGTSGQCLVQGTGQLLAARPRAEEGQETRPP